MYNVYNILQTYNAKVNYYVFTWKYQLLWTIHTISFENKDGHLFFILYLCKTLHIIFKLRMIKVIYI